MTKKNELLRGKRILIVDDEVDVLEILEQQLSMCHVVKASTFEKAKELLSTEYFDIAILDIMGVDGYKLLEIASERKVLSVMLTAHALSPQHLMKSIKNGAASYVPKEKLNEIATFLNDILEAKEQGKHLWWRWYDRLGSFFERRFGPDWEKEDKEFWSKFRRFD
jgi:DNA-binding response OmpR family regulator